jgi:hypothetical protein
VIFKKPKWAALWYIPACILCATAYGLSCVLWVFTLGAVDFTKPLSALIQAIEKKFWRDQ